MLEIIKPKIICEDNEQVGDARFIVEPLQRGFGTTIGNALRRILLASLPGAAPIGIKIEGIKHEFSTIPGVREDVTEIILNIKGLAIKAHSNDKDFRKIITLKKNTPGPVIAGDIMYDSEIEILNPDHYICSIEQGGSIEMEITVGLGVGYVSADHNKDIRENIGYIPVDSIYTPVVSANYAIENTRVGQNIDYDKLTIEVKTNGTISAREVLSLAAKILDDHIKLFVNLVDNMSGYDVLISPDEENQNKILEMPVEDLELSARSYNCLKRANIHTIQDLSKKTYEDMLKVRNLGSKSLDEIMKKMAELGLSLRNKED
jgi:DNA-directed RNA polymerase subunit alpha